MARFTKIPIDTFKQLVINAGVVLKNFDPASPSTDFDDDIVGATSGGVNFSAVPTFVDNGADIDNCPVDTKELKEITGWAVKMTGSFVTLTADTAKMLIAAADKATAGNKITPRMDLADTDFTDLWLVGDYSDKNGETKGGFAAIKILNALSTGGLSIQTENRGKTKIAFEFTGHVSISAQTVVPFEVYIKAGEAESTG